MRSEHFATENVTLCVFCISQFAQRGVWVCMCSCHGAWNDEKATICSSLLIKFNAKIKCLNSVKSLIKTNTIPLAVAAVLFLLLFVRMTLTTIHKIHILTIQSLHWHQITILFIFSVLMRCLFGSCCCVAVVNHERA